MAKSVVYVLIIRYCWNEDPMFVYDRSDITVLLVTPDLGKAIKTANEPRRGQFRGYDMRLEDNGVIVYRVKPGHVFEEKSSNMVYRRLLNSNLRWEVWCARKLKKATKRVA